MTTLENANDGIPDDAPEREMEKKINEEREYESMDGNKSMSEVSDEKVVRKLKDEERKKIKDELRIIKGEHGIERNPNPD